MRVLFIINSFSFGGAEKLVMDLSKAIVSQCDSVGIVALYREGDAVEEQLVSQLGAKNIKTYILDKRAGKDRISAVVKTVKIVRTEKPDVIHGHCSVPMLIGKLAGFLTSTPVIATVHNTRGYSTMREKLTGWMCGRYVSIGAAAEAYMTDTLKIPRRKITRIYNAVDTNQFVPTSKTKGFWTEYGLREDLPVVINIGRVVEQKNQMCLLRALAECRDRGKPVQGVILGRYDEGSSVYLQMKAYIEANELGDLVRFLGHRNPVTAFLNNADSFVMTSFYEGLSVSFLEALFCGTPIVVTRMPFVEELEEIGTCAAVIAQDDSEALCHVLLSGAACLPDEPVLRQIRSQFSMDHFAQRHLALYRQITCLR